MKTKSLALTSVLIALGYVFHTVVPPLFFGMKPDLLLVMMFLAIMLAPTKQNVLIASMAAGVISALTTGMAGGQIANIVEKPITAFLFLGMFLLARKVKVNTINVVVLTVIGTIVSGTLFLLVAMMVAGLPGSLFSFIGMIVFPTSIISGLIMFFIFPVANRFSKRSSLTA
ncbi:tryptophan transporter [Fictibacillus phosphorivorans]|uniref:tryptophan transporter n=1 Tax=Fictibacillus phosphorivorans TaxID=1221500 RepID=UPI0020400ECB|nr:tryptophan transporter [Fictibacillus phosphorivorans]MCM3717493.1 tryptophan transporter [Fictibacillus phosphorivorans]MCM3775188.1 tryptophan transporter [Fictibacillus phosphorivorans]